MTPAQDKLTVDYLYLVRPTAVSVAATLKEHADIDDLKDAGVLGLLDAASKYDESKNVTFPCYAKFRIRGAILDYLRSNGTSSRTVLDHHRKLDLMKKVFRTTTGREATEEETAQLMGCRDVNHWRKTMLSMKKVGVVSFSSLQQDEQDRPFDSPASPASNPAVMVAIEERKEQLMFALKGLSERHQQVVFLFYSKDLENKDIARILKLTPGRISQLHKEALGHLRGTLHKRGVRSSHAFSMAGGQS